MPVPRAHPGLPCPGCGITTSLLALARGDAHASWSANPAGLAVAALLVGQAVISIVAMRRGARVNLGLRLLAWLDRMAIGGLVAASIGRLMWTLS